MKTNVEKVLERDQKLSELDDRAGKSFFILNTRVILKKWLWFYVSSIPNLLFSFIMSIVN